MLDENTILDQFKKNHFRGQVLDVKDEVLTSLIRYVTLIRYNGIHKIIRDRKEEV